ncbi:MAG: sigma-70 family RNA polymerase sigma factor [Bacteroidales bacterium]|nr:sigma-70 family RNA polymerase sigma factor [Bacteroidales bacterium]
MNNAPKNNEDELLLLIEGCKQNKRGAQHKLFKLFYGSMFSICVRYATDDDEAQDMLNEGFIKIFANIGNYRDTGSFEGWLKRIMVNAAIDYRRKYKTFANTYIEYSEIAETAINGASENEAIAKMSADELIRMIQELPPMSKTVFNLFVFDGYSHTEIAEALNIKEGTSFWHLNNARNILKEKIIKQKGYGR